MKTFLNSIWGIVLVILIYKGFNYVVALDNEIKEHVGTQIRLNEEYREIIDYSLIHRSYVLDNGQEISVEYVINN